MRYTSLLFPSSFPSLPLFLSFLPPSLPTSLPVLSSLLLFLSFLPPSLPPSLSSCPFSLPPSLPLFLSFLPSCPSLPLFFSPFLSLPPSVPHWIAGSFCICHQAQLKIFHMNRKPHTQPLVWDWDVWFGLKRNWRRMLGGEGV